VLDVNDQCPNQAGPVENAGCPIPDRDGDGVPDDVDNCPDEPGLPENKGCQQKQLVEIQQGRLEILEKVYFKTNSSAIRPRSFPLLDNVAAVLSAHPEITSVRVEGHTDERGSAKYNRRLSQKRAESVVRFLVRRGIDANRLEAEGFGEDRPIMPDATTKEEHAQNRRVEFHLGDTEIQQRESGPTSDTIDR
jgi:outer membrane protein OmpA-like peptidoglycan-associated protein